MKSLLRKIVEAMRVRLDSGIAATFGVRLDPDKEWTANGRTREFRLEIRPHDRTGWMHCDKDQNLCLDMNRDFSGSVNMPGRGILHLSYQAARRPA